MSRFRLRFLLQEFDLPTGDVLIGRSPECHITIEDPLISRQHTKIRVVDDAATLIDLGSRNGTRLNGRPITAPTPLSDADRIRIGAQELVFYQVGAEQRAPRQTGALLFCSSCGTPFPEGAAVCPHCGHTQTPMREDETVSGLYVEPRRTWMLQLFGEVLDRALSTGRHEEAERILRRAIEEYNERSNGGAGELRHLNQIAEYALRLADARGESAWVIWTIDAYAKLERLPPLPIVERLASVTRLPGTLDRVRDLLKQWRIREGTLNAEDLEAMSRLESIGAAPGV